MLESVDLRPNRLSNPPPAAVKGVDPQNTPHADDPWHYRRYLPRHDPRNYDPLGEPLPPLGGLLPHPGLTLLAAPPKSGKTTLAVALAWAVATGTPFAGVPVPAGPAVLLDYESSDAERRAALAPLPTGLHPEHRLHVAPYAPRLDDSAFRPFFEWILGTMRPLLLVVNSLRGAVLRAALDRPAAVRRLLGPLADVAGNTVARGGPGTAVLVLHHTDAHARRASESVQLPAVVRATALLSNDPLPEPAEEDAEGAEPRLLTLRLSGRDLGAGPAGTRTVRLEARGPLDYRPHAPILERKTEPNIIEPAPLDATCELLLELLARLAPQADRPDPDSATLAAAAGLPLRTVQHALTRLLRAERIVSTRHRQTFRYRLAKGSI